MNYKVEHAEPSRDSSGNYWYKIYKDEQLIAKYWHDFRGDEHSLEFLDGTEKYCPLERMTGFIKGGGSEPLTLSNCAIELLNCHNQ